MLRAVTPGSGEPRAQERPGRARCQQEPHGGGSAACAFRGLGQVGLLELEAAVSSALRLRQARSEFVEVQGLVILCVFRDRKHRLLEQPWGTQRPGRRRVRPCLLGASGARCPLRRLAFTALCWPAGPGPRLQPARTAPQSPRACRARTLCSRMSPTLPGAPGHPLYGCREGGQASSQEAGEGAVWLPRWGHLLTRTRAEVTPRAGRGQQIGQGTGRREECGAWHPGGQGPLTQGDAEGERRTVQGARPRPTPSRPRSLSLP